MIKLLRPIVVWSFHSALPAWHVKFAPFVTYYIPSLEKQTHEPGIESRLVNFSI